MKGSHPLRRTEIAVLALMLGLGITAWVAVVFLAVGAVVNLSVIAPALVAGVAVVALALAMLAAVRKACGGPRQTPPSTG